MKVPVRKPALNSFKAYEGQNEKPRRKFWSKKRELYIYFVYRKTLNKEQSNWICGMWTTGFPVQIL